MVKMDHMDESIGLKDRLADLSRNFNSGHLPIIYNGVYLCLEALGQGDFFENLEFNDFSKIKSYGLETLGDSKNPFVNVEESWKTKKFRNGSVYYFVVDCDWSKPLIFEKPFNLRQGRRWAHCYDLNIGAKHSSGHDPVYAIINEGVKTRRVQCIENPVNPVFNEDVFSRFEGGLSRLLQVTGYVSGNDKKKMKYLLDCFSNIL
jgi:hypothetical protein